MDIVAFLKMQNVYVRYGVASNPATPPAVLAELKREGF
mgnify:CR=1 FL=1